MSIMVRLSLLFVSTFVLFFVIKRIRKSQVQIEDIVFWILFMFGLVITSIFPNIVISISNIIGIESPANFVFLSMIFLLLIKLFNLSMHVSKLQYQIQQLTKLIVLVNLKQKEEKKFEEKK